LPEIGSGLLENDPGDGGASEAGAPFGRRRDALNVAEVGDHGPEPVAENGLNACRGGCQGLDGLWISPGCGGAQEVV